MMSRSSPRSAASSQRLTLALKQHLGRPDCSHHNGGGRTPGAPPLTDPAQLSKFARLDAGEPD
jgi:hypothetical protein